MDLNSAKVFVSVVEHGGFTAAAKALNMPISTVSRRVAELELSLNIRLLERSTRQIRLTESGSTLFHFISRGLVEMEAGLLALQERETELKGVLKLSTPPNFEPWWHLIEAFQSDYPNIQVDLLVTEKKLDLIDDGIDVALRVGKVESLSSVAKRILRYRHVLIATADYLAQQQAINQPSDLKNVPIVAWAKKDQPVQWRLPKETLVFQPKLRTNDYAHILHLARTGKYLTEVPFFLAADGLKSGEFIEVLPDYPLPQFDINLVYPSRKQLSKIARVYIDYVVNNIEKYIDVRNYTG